MRQDNYKFIHKIGAYTMRRDTTLGHPRKNGQDLYARTLTSILMPIQQQNYGGL
jgi:hypothetical protein